MSRVLLLYEDREWRALRPLTDLVPVPALTFGASTLTARWQRAAAAPLLSIEARTAALAAWAGRPAPETGRPGVGDEVLVINAAALPGAWLERALVYRAPAIFLSDQRVAGARLPFGTIAAGVGRGENFETFLLGLGLAGFEVEAEFLQYPWDLIARNADAIATDLTSERGEVRGRVHPLAVLLAPEHITVEFGARVEALAVLDAREGPIRIGARALVQPYTVVTGPCAVGDGTQLLGGFIGRSTFGPECRIAGEVEECVWQGYSNKRHHGFVGHSAIGEWVNLGALTTTSDLKNNYGTVRVWLDGAERETGATKIGALIGAHAKTGIGTLLPTGASIGVGSNLFGGGKFAPKRVPSFAWWDGERMETHELEKFLATARTATSRRGRALLPADEALLRTAFDATAPERNFSIAASP